MLPSILAKQLEKGIGDYIETTFPMTNAPFKGSVHNMLKEYRAQGHNIEEAVHKAVNWCIENNCLSEYFRMHKSEVIGMVLTEYNEKEVMSDLAKESYKDGYDSGYDSGRSEEMANTAKERLRADNAENRLADTEIKLSDATAYIKELEAKLAKK